MDTLKLSANETSTLGWGKRITGFISCSVVVAVCLVLAVYMLWVPLIGLTLFTVFYTVGNICAVCSTMFLMEPETQLALMFDETRVHATAAVMTCLVLTLCSAFWVKSAGLAMLFCILQVLSFIWYLLTYIPNWRADVKKMVETCKKILSNCIQSLMELVNQVKELYEKSPALAVIAGLVSTIFAALLWSTFGLGLLLFGILGGLLCTGMLSNCTKFLTGLLQQVKSICGGSTALAVIAGLVSTIFAALLGSGFGLALLFGVLGGFLIYWIKSSCTKFLTGLLQQVKSICGGSTALAVIAGLVSTIFAALLGSGFGLALLFGVLGGFLIYWFLSDFLMGILKQLTWIWDKARPLAIIICLLLILLAAFWWGRAGLALLFWILTMMLILW
ncbi:uncharacterized protein AB9X84_016398 isoform 2-T2 [Acanthopagrus schlegelii]